MVDLIISDLPKELEEYIHLIFQVHTDRTINEITHHRNNGGLLAFSCRLGRLECARILIDAGAGIRIRNAKL